MASRAAPHVGLATTACLALLLGNGCWQPPTISDDEAVRGLVYVLPGIDGGPGTMKWPYRALRDGGVTSEIRVLTWTRGLDAWDNLTDLAGNLVQSAAVAADIAAYRQAHPEAPIDIVGYSGGGGLAVLAAELLPEDVHVRNVLLVHAAISPDYCLDSALLHVDGKLVNFYSPVDWLVLGWGTEVFGTIDRSYSESAGKDGFDLQRATADEQLAAKVEQVCWTPDMRRTGHLGTHICIISYEWNKEYVAPYLLPEQTGQ